KSNNYNKFPKLSSSRQPEKFVAFSMRLGLLFKLSPKIPVLTGSTKQNMDLGDK
ncbi:2847_t:CDS:1, partial [Gigaspora rosea]